jgi:hypothetical protein
VLTCFTMMLHKGLMMGGGIADYMSYELGHIPLTMEPHMFVMRIVYDMLFFIVVLGESISPPPPPRKYTSKSFLIFRSGRSAPTLPVYSLAA